MLRTLQTSISDPSAYAVNRVQHDDLLYCNTINYGRALFDVYLPNCRPVTKQNSQAEPAKFNVNFMRTTTDSVHLLCCIWSSSSCNKDGIQPRAASTEFCLVSTLPPVFDPYTLPLQNVVDRLKVLRFPEIAVYSTHGQIGQINPCLKTVPYCRQVYISKAIRPVQLMPNVA